LKNHKEWGKINKEKDKLTLNKVQMAQE